MTEVKFYILPDSAAHGRERLACRLAEKAYNLGRKVYIHTGSASETAYLDELLWTFREGSFLPHAVKGEAGDEPPPIQLGHDGEGDGSGDVLINLAADVPLFFSNYARVTELVNQEQQHLARSREHYRFYQERGYELESHKL